MAKQKLSKTQIRLFIVLGILIAYALYDLTSTKEKPVEKEKNKKTTTVTAQTAVANQTVATVTAAKSAPVVTFATWKRDPFKKRIEITSRVSIGKMVESLVVPKMTNFNLSAISKNGKKSYAIINDQIVGVGELVNGFRVIEIQTGSVILKKNDFTFTLVLPEEDYEF